MLLGSTAAADPLMRAIVLGYFPGRSGELVLAPKPYWTASIETTSHGTGHRYDTHVPVILYGAGVKRGEYLQPASPLDIAPTLAMVAGVTLPSAHGRVLREALAK
jgi:arylsulfatase A-like enzyme